MSRIVKAVLFVVVLSGFAMAQTPWGQIWKKATTPSASNLPSDRIAAGLREALSVSTTRAVAKVGRPDGFLKNEAIRILLPEKMRTAERGLRMFGMGQQLDDLEVGMNRAAEQATPLAKQIFLNALMKMSISDARQILTGGDTAATEYFRTASSDDLAAVFAPIIHKSLQNVGVVEQYDQLMQNPLAAPLLRSKNFDLDNYVVSKTLDGLFYTLGQEEKQIRQDPAARTTSILREVFGAKQSSK